MEEEVILLNKKVSMFGMRAVVALGLKGINYEYKEEDLSNKSPLLLKANPINKQIPVLIHKGKSICESLIILEYIDEVWNTPVPLLPSDPYQRAHARFWANFVDSKVHSAGKKIWASKVEEHETGKKELIESLKQLEEYLGENPYFGGNTPGFVDVALIPFYQWFNAWETVGNFKVEPHCPKFIAWANRFSNFQGIRQSLTDPHQIIDFVLTYRNNNGLD